MANQMESPAGGNSGYVFAWDSGESTAQATALNEGVHTVTVTDAPSCVSNHEAFTPKGILQQSRVSRKLKRAILVL